MPLNKLENFIKNTEGRILYVNPNDLDSTDAIENQGNSLTKPFKTVQRALIESARFSYLTGNDNDITEKTTILLFPGEHVIDNRPGFAIKDDSGTAKAVSPSGSETVASVEFELSTDSVFDITQENNILYRFNSVNGGVVVPRGTSIVGLDLRKTKLRPKYVPNPTDDGVSNSAVFRITGACYFWQFSVFDGDESGLVYTDPSDFSSNNRSKPTFSHNKLTVFEYCDGVNNVSGYTLSDLDMYYAKLSNAFNSTNRRIEATDRYPANSIGFSKQRPEFEIVGAFAADPVNISTIISGDGFTPGSIITVTTSTPHGLTAGTPIKIKGVGVEDYNVSTKVQNVSSTTQFTYLLPFVRVNLPASPSAASATVTIETDTVTGASPYIFNISMRSVWGMQGMHADGSKATGFRSMVVAQFTAISLQKDDRAFVKYNSTSRLYEGIAYTKVTGAALSSGSSATNSTQVYHLDSDARYREGWETTHIKGTNDAFIQIVSVFAIGFSRHFFVESGGDYSLTNSNSNFGQISLAARGFKKDAFAKDDKAYVTSIITPRAITSTEEDIDWISLDVDKTISVGISSHLYLEGFEDANDKPPVLIQGYRVGAKVDDKLFVKTINGASTFDASIHMVDTDPTSGVVFGTTSSVKEYTVSSVTSSILNVGVHKLRTGEKIRVLSDTGDLPENVSPHRNYFTIVQSANQIKLASSLTNAENGTAITIFGGDQLRVLSRVSDKDAGDVGSPLQYDPTNSQWYIHTAQSNDIYTNFVSQGTSVFGTRSEVSFFKRFEDPRSIDEKLYKLRVVVPKEFDNAKNPEEGFVIQESSTTGLRADTDATLTTIGASDFDFNRNARFISTCTEAANVVTVITELPHNLNVNDKVTLKKVSSTSNTTATENVGFNGTFTVASVTGDKTFTYSTTDVDGVTHTTGSFTNDTSSRTTDLPRFVRTDLQNNYYIYRNDVISEYKKDVQDGVYHLFVLNAGNAIPTEFTDDKYSQQVEDLYPQLDRDNLNENPLSAKTFAKRSPIGSVETNDQKKSITRETVDGILKDFGIGLPITGIADGVGISTITFGREHGFSGIVTCAISNNGSGMTNGTYQNVKLLNNGTTTWDGATARVVVSGNAVTQVDVLSGGSAYTNGETLDLDNTFTGGSGAEVTISTAGISSAIGNTVQVTGVGTATGGYFRINGVPSTTQISVATTSGDASIATHQYVINVGREIRIASDTFDAATGLSVFTTSLGHGLVAGNRITIKDASDNNLGSYLVTAATTTTVTAKTNANLNGLYILKNALSANDKFSDNTGENLGARGLQFYGNEVMTLGANISSGTTLEVSVPNAGISTTQRFELGSYIQVDNEIMRITSSTLSGSSNNEISVIRGVLGTVKENHVAGALITKITPRAIQFHRPSIIRASGHTFEYLGYGPGNYSTSLPQVQVKTLSEEEEFLAQAEESSCGIVVYSGLNNDGDFFIGNKKINSATGKESTFDIPVATITGQDPSRLSVVFDEVIVKERLLVEGGKSKTILSEFDGPVNFGGQVKVNGGLTVNGIFKLNNTFNITDTTQSINVDTGAFTVDGGVGINKNLNVGGLLNVAGVVTATSFHGDGSQLTGIDQTRLVDSNGATRVQATTTGATVTGDITADGGDFGNITVGVSNDNTITTTSGNLTLDSNGGTLVVNDDLDVNGTGTHTFAGSISVTGSGTFTNDVIAFASDDRLKTNKISITGALDKVDTLNGFTYNFNEAAGELGFDIDIRYAGVSAQEVREVLPEAVHPAPVGKGYITVQYEKLVPLLIEAIKELRQEVKDLRNSINN